MAKAVTMELRYMRLPSVYTRFLVCWLTILASTLISGSDSVSICQTGNGTETGTETQTLAEVLSAFKQTQTVDMIFLLDKSSNIDSALLQLQKDFINIVLEYGRLSGYTWIHPDYTRIAIISFAKSEATHLGFMTTYTACQLKQYIDSVMLTTNEAASDSSNVNSALQRAQELFQKSGRVGKKIVWLMFDGNYGDDKSETAVQETAKFLRDDDVEIFGVGLGEQGENLLNLVTDMFHYACLSHWIDIFKTPPAEKEVPPIYDVLSGPSLRALKSECVKCKSTEECVCDVTAVKLDCTCGVDMQYSENNSCVACPKGRCKAKAGNHGCSTCPVTEEDSAYKFDGTKLYIILAGLLGGFVILALFLLVIFLFISILRYKKQTPKDPAPPPACTVSSGGPIPTPRRQIGMVGPFQSSKNIEQQNIPRNSMPRALPPPPPKVPSQRSTSPMHRIARQPDADDEPGDYQNFHNVRRSIHGIMDVARLSLHDVIRKDSAVYEKQMPGWYPKLEDIVQNSKIEALAVYAVDYTSWVRTKSIRFKKQSITDMEWYMRERSSLYANAPEYHFTIGPNRFRVDQDNISGLKMKLTGPAIDEESAHTTALWVYRSGIYLIIARTDIADSDQCDRELSDLQQHLLESQGMTLNETQEMYLNQNGEF